MPLSPKVRALFEHANELTALETNEAARVLGSAVTENNITAGSLTDVVVKALLDEPRDPDQHEHGEAGEHAAHRSHRRQRQHAPAEPFDTHARGLQAVADATGLSQS